GSKLRDRKPSLFNAFEIFDHTGSRFNPMKQLPTANGLCFSEPSRRRPSLSYRKLHITGHIFPRGALLRRMTSYACAISFAKICPGNCGYDGMRVEVLLRKIALCILLASVLVACRGDRNEYSYETLADADKAGEIARGWIPDGLMPSSSRAIRLVEELSPSREWCAFEFLPADSQNLKKNLKNVDTLPPSVRRVR